MTSYANRLVTTVSAVAGSGLGAFTVSTAATSYRTFTAADNGKTFDISLVEGTAWEVRTGCVYTHATLSLSRGTLEASSTGSAVAFTASAVLTVTPTAAKFDALQRAMSAVIPGGRLTLESGVPVSVTDQVAKTTIFYTPFVHNIVSLWDGVQWQPVTFAQTELPLGTVIASRPYDVFGYLSGGVLALEMLAWTNDSTRATAVTLQDGRYCKSGDKTRLLLGTFYTTSTTTTEDSAGGTTTQVGGKRFLWNMYHRVRRDARVIDTADSWTQTAGAAYRKANNASGVLNCVEMIVGIASDAVTAQATSNISSSTAATSGSTGVGIDTSSTNSAQIVNKWYTTGGSVYVFSLSATYRGAPSAGYHYLAWLENATDSTPTVTWEGDGGSSAAAGRQAGMSVELFA